MMSSRPVKRRIAYKIYNYTQYVNRIARVFRQGMQAEGLDWKAFTNTADIFAHGRKYGLHVRDVKTLCRGKGVSRDLLARCYVKVERDIFSERRRFHTWTRYKVAGAYRRTSDFHKRMDSLNKDMAQLKENLEAVCAKLGIPSSEAAQSIQAVTEAIITGAVEPETDQSKDGT